METDTFSDTDVFEKIDMANEYLAEHSVQLALNNNTIKAIASDGKTIADAVLLPCNPTEHICHDGKRAHIGVTSFCNSEWLPTVEIHGRLNKLDMLYDVWGMHKFPELSKDEEKNVKKIFSVLAQHLEGSKVYSLLAGWIDEKTLLIKNVIITKDSIEYITNSEVKKELKIL